MKVKVRGIKMEAVISLVTWGETKAPVYSNIWRLWCPETRSRMGKLFEQGAFPLSYLEKGHVVMTWLCIEVESVSLSVDMSRSHHVKDGKALGIMSFQRQRLRCFILLQRADCGYRWQDTAIFPTDPNKALEFVSPLIAWTHTWSSSSHKGLLDLWSTSFWTIKKHAIPQRNIDEEPGFRWSLLSHSMIRQKELRDCNALESEFGLPAKECFVSGKLFSYLLNWQRLWSGAWSSRDGKRTNTGCIG